MEKMKHLLGANINWTQDTNKDLAIWHASYKGRSLRLIMNDFPDEPLYTVVDGDERLDFDDRPSGWDIPF